jgi:hypothetical protein
MSVCTDGCHTADEHVVPIRGDYFGVCSCPRIFTRVADSGSPAVHTLSTEDTATFSPPLAEFGSPLR